MNRIDSFSIDFFYLRFEKSLENIFYSNPTKFSILVPHIESEFEIKCSFYIALS